MDFNVRFLEYYKQLDQIFIQRYGFEHGISDYIEHMRARYGDGIGNTRLGADLKKLRYLRHKRNQLVHDVGTMYQYLCTQDDIVWLEYFFRRMGYAPNTMRQAYGRERAWTQHVQANHVPSAGRQAPADGSGYRAASKQMLPIILAVVCVLAILGLLIGMFASLWGIAGA